jgi:hypothetical protein
VLPVAPNWGHASPRGRRCFTYASEYGALVDAARASGDTIKAVSERFGLGYGTVKRHRAAHHHLQTYTEGDQTND